MRQMCRYCRYSAPHTELEGELFCVKRNHAVNKNASCDLWKKKSMTGRDKINRMSNEELADALFQGDFCPLSSGIIDECIYNECDCNIKCIKDMLESEIKD